MGHSVYIAATCCGFINIETTIAKAIGAETSPADFLLTMRQAESLTLAAQLFICWIRFAWPL